MQHNSMKQVLSVSKRGTITLPPAYRRKVGLDAMENPLFLFEERDGQIILEPAAAIPVRDLPQAKLDAWIAEDEADGEALRATWKQTP